MNILRDDSQDYDFSRTPRNVGKKMELKAILIDIHIYILGDYVAVSVTTTTHDNSGTEPLSIIVVIFLR